jgi:TonB-linked SusC/RagA family outer membrane protein
MSRNTMSRRLFSLGVVGALLVSTTGGAQAQEGVISGTVTGEAGEPLAGASVLAVELGFGTSTNAQGRYVLTVSADKVHGQRLTLRARSIGFAPGVLAVTLAPGSQTADFRLKSDPLRLEEVVVTGVADATERNKLPFVVSSVDATELRAAPGMTALSALAGKVAGAAVLQASAEPGTPPAIKLRGATSLSGNQEPLIIVDGTITRFTLADINSGDIERVEVIKGAAASSLYGSDAANGVIQVFTRRGQHAPEGGMSFTVRNEAGSSFFSNYIEQTSAHQYRIDADGNYVLAAGSRVLDTLPCGDGRPVDPADPSTQCFFAVNPYSVVHNHQEEALRPGVFYTNYVSLGQRRANTNFNLSFENSRQDGVLFGIKGYTRRNFRVNVDQALAPQLDLSVGGFYGSSNNDQTDQGPGSTFFALAFVEPDVDLQACCNPDGTPFVAEIPNRFANAANPLYALSQISNVTDRTRFTGAVKLRYRPLAWLSLEGNYNYDQFADGFKRLVPFGFYDGNGVAGTGGLLQSRTGGKAYNYGVTLTSVRRLGATATNTTKLAYVGEHQDGDSVITTAGTLTLGRVPEFAAGANIIASSTDFSIRNRNAYLVSTFTIKDRYIIDGLVRRDESSLFGPNNRSSWYYRGSLAWRLTEDFRISGIDELRLRASYGTAGLRPGFNYQYETFRLVGGVPVKQTLGNTDLKPALSGEAEAGVNVDFLRRFTFEATYSRKYTKDQIILVPLSAATGYQNQWQNNGSLLGVTWEAALGAVLANRPDFDWRVNITGDRTRQRVGKLNTTPFLVGPTYGQVANAFFSTSADIETVTKMFRIAPGEKFGVIYGSKTVRTLAELYTDPAKQALSGPGQTWSRDSVIINEEGYVVRRNDWRTANERPIKFVDADGNTSVPIGDVNPDFALNFNTNMRYRGLAVHATLNWVQGGNIYNGTRQWPFFENRDRIYDQRSKPPEARKPLAYYNFFYNSIDPIDLFVEDGTYLKLKELAVTYSFSPSQLAKLGFLQRLSGLSIGIVGRNLLTFTNYSGYDPEVAGQSGDPYSYRFDGFSYPNFRTFTGVVEISF